MSTLFHQIGAAPTRRADFYVRSPVVPLERPLLEVDVETGPADPVTSLTVDATPSQLTLPTRSQGPGLVQQVGVGLTAGAVMTGFALCALAAAGVFAASAPAASIIVGVMSPVLVGLGSAALAVDLLERLYQRTLLLREVLSKPGLYLGAAAGCVLAATIGVTATLPAAAITSLLAGLSLAGAVLGCAWSMGSPHVRLFIVLFLLSIFGAASYLLDQELQRPRSVPK